MSFEKFQSTRTDCADLGAFLQDESLEGRPGLIYCGALYIEKANSLWPEEARERGAYDLILGRDEWISPDLETLERKLYAYALSEGFTEA